MASRRRNTVLQTVEIFRALNGNVSLTQIIAYFYIAENEGLSITELSHSFRTTVATASRAARALYSEVRPEALPPALGLVEPRPHPAIPHARLLYLTAAGVAFREQIDRVIAAGAPIRVEPHGGGGRHVGAARAALGIASV